MIDKEPVAELDPRFSSNDATVTPWAEARERLQQAEVFWLSSTVLVRCSVTNSSRRKDLR